MKKPSGTTVVYIGYVFFLLGFVSLGLLVAALAFRSPLAVWPGFALVGTFAVAVAALRAGSVGVANIWAESVTRTEADRYASTYRSDERTTQAASDPVEVTRWAA